MKKLLILLLIVLAGCSPQRKFQRLTDRYPSLLPKPETTIVTTIKTEIEYRDTTINYTLPTKTVYDTTYIEVTKEGKMWSDSAYVESNYAQSWAWVKSRQLFLTIADKDTTLALKLENAVKESNHWKNMYEKQIQIIPERYIPKWIKILAWIGGIVVLSGMVIGVLKLKRLVGF